MSNNKTAKKGSPKRHLTREQEEAKERRSRIQAGKETFERYDLETSIQLGQLKKDLFDDVYPVGSRFGTMFDSVNRASLRCLIGALREALMAFQSDKRWCARNYSKKMWEMTKLSWFSSMIDNLWILADICYSSVEWRDQKGSDGNMIRVPGNDEAQQIMAEIFANQHDPRGTPKSWSNYVLRKGDRTPEDKELVPFDVLIDAILRCVRESERQLFNGHGRNGRTWAGLMDVQNALAYLVSTFPEKVKIEYDDGSHEFVDPWVQDVRTIMDEANQAWEKGEADWHAKQEEWVQKKAQRESGESGESGESDQVSSSSQGEQWHRGGQQYGSHGKKGRRQHNKYRDADIGSETDGVSSQATADVRAIRQAKKEANAKARKAKDDAEMERLREKSKLNAQPAPVVQNNV